MSPKSSLKRTKREEYLTAQHNAAPVDELLMQTPTILSRTKNNCLAIARTIHLSAFYYPNAYRYGHRAISVSELVYYNGGQDYAHIGVGQGHRLEAGITLHTPRKFERDTDTATVSMMYRTNQAAQRSGRMLLAHGIEHVLAQGYEQLELSVANRNTVARDLYASLGFQEQPVTLSGRTPRKFIPMVLPNQAALVTAHNALLERL